MTVHEDGPARASVDVTDRTAVLRAFSPGGSNYVDTEGHGEQLSASAGDLRIINERHSSEKLGAGDVEIFERYVANDQVMRRPLRFTKAALQRLTESFIEGRTVLLDHDERRPIGHTFAADVVSAKVRGVQANWLRVKFYAVTKGASEQRLQDIQDVKSGVRKYDSIEVRGGTWTFQEEGPEDARIHYYLVDDGPGLEAGELSMVYLGAVRGAGSDKGVGLNAGRDTPVTPETDPYVLAGCYDLPVTLDPYAAVAEFGELAMPLSTPQIDPANPYKGLDLDAAADGEDDPYAAVGA